VRYSVPDNRAEMGMADSVGDADSAKTKGPARKWPTPGSPGEVLQSAALPLGYGAASLTARAVFTHLITGCQWSLRGRRDNVLTVC
jgi:hypothetical protein